MGRHLDTPATPGMMPPDLGGEAGHTLQITPNLHVITTPATVHVTVTPVTVRVTATPEITPGTATLVTAQSSLAARLMTLLPLVLHQARATGRPPHQPQQATRLSPASTVASLVTRLLSVL